MPLKLGLPSAVGRGRDAGPRVERVTANAIPAPTTADRTTMTIIAALIRLAMANLLRSLSILVYKGRCRHDNPGRINVKRLPLHLRRGTSVTLNCTPYSFDLSFSFYDACH